jgi:hypothetical protein
VRIVALQIVQRPNGWGSTLPLEMHRDDPWTAPDYGVVDGAAFATGDLTDEGDEFRAIPTPICEREMVRFAGRHPEPRHQQHNVLRWIKQARNSSAWPCWHHKLIREHAVQSERQTSVLSITAARIAEVVSAILRPVMV